jgi:hypothetical protein
VLTAPDSLALRVTHASAPRFTLDEVSSVIDALAALGYEFVPPGVPGKYGESDEYKTHMARYLVGKTSLPLHVARDVLTAIGQFGLRIREPDAHPTAGSRTTAMAFEHVPRSGAQRAAAQKPRDDRMPNMGRNYAT